MIYLYNTKELGLMKISLDYKRFEKVNKLANEQQTTFDETLTRVLSRESREQAHRAKRP